MTYDAQHAHLAKVVVFAWQDGEIGRGFHTQDTYAVKRVSLIITIHSARTGGVNKDNG
jgi:hypothetical protein